MDSTFVIAGRSVQVAAIVVIVAVVQWLLFATASLLSRARRPKTALRTTERNLIGSSAALALVWIAFAAISADWGQTKTVRASSVLAKTTTGTCANLERGMKSDVVRAQVGEPEEIRNEEAIRGPHAEAWIYRGSRCAVHLVEGKIEFIE
jgi:hypothetical protein